MNRLIYETKHRSLEDIQVELSKIISFNQEEKEYIFAKCLSSSGDHNKVLDYSKKYFKDSTKWLNLHLLALDHLKQEKVILQIINEKTDLEDPLYLIISKHLKAKYCGKQEEIIEYIKKDITTQLVTDDYEILVYLMKECDALLTKFQHYKYAVSTYRFFIHKFNKLENS